MEERNLLEKLVEVSPGMEIWWDSSPVIFDNWTKRILAGATGAKKEVLARQVKRMYSPDGEGNPLFRGVTTNPPLSLAAIRDDESYWHEVVAQMQKDHQGDAESLYWALYKEIVRRGSAMYLPLFEKSGYRAGYLSGQVDPRSSFDRERMLAQADELAAINPNVMIKIPGTEAGYEVIEILTARGIATNNTLSFSLPQLMDCARSVKRGLARAKSEGVDLTRWRSVITHMEARYGDLGGLREEAQKVGIELTEADVRWAELAIFKKAYRLLKEGDYPSKLLSCSLRLGPTVNGELRLWHLEEKAGAAVVVTCPPPFIEDILNFPHPERIVFAPDRIYREIPGEVLKRLLQVPYFARAYREDGYGREEYATQPALKKTVAQFNRATEEMVDFVRNCLTKRG
jgi:transaldolase